MLLAKENKKQVRHRNRPKLSRGDIAFNIVNYTVFALITLACVFPL